ncbi:MAG: coproporphyrinogen III oxidase [Chitinophagaceae bacterium]|nr:coproporphyrinogen III oxidase [Oligoflexus sp.]
MSLVLAQSNAARLAYDLVKGLQAYFVSRLDELQHPAAAHSSQFYSVDWLRAQGDFGGGNRFTAKEDTLFNRASVNISQVQYESDPSKKLGSATALSTIVHPKNPFAPSMHMHISWTEMKNGSGYWRIMADLNPSMPDEAQTALFEKTMRETVDALWEEGKAQGERYFYIPALGRHRGTAHFYLEEYGSQDPVHDRELAKRFGHAIIDVYIQIVADSLTKHPLFEGRYRDDQLAYHSLYFLQVLTLDRGTTSGLLVHNENDTGILASLPAEVDKVLLQSWVTRLPSVQAKLLQELINVLNGDRIALVDDEAKVKIADVSRLFYKNHPEALELLARGDRIPPTQDNHKSV